MKRSTITLLIAALVVWSNFAIGQTIAKVKPSKMVVQGSSSLHDWESEITKADWKGSFIMDANKLTEIKNVEVKIPVESIKSTKGKMMDGKTYDAFNYKKHPFITYSLGKVVLNNGTFQASGNLTMAGVTKPIELTGQYKVLSNKDIQLTVSKKLKMTEFKMEPPTAMMGTIKVGDDVTVVFDVILTINQTADLSKIK